MQSSSSQRSHRNPNGQRGRKLPASQPYHGPRGTQTRGGALGAASTRRSRPPRGSFGGRPARSHSIGSRGLSFNRGPQFFGLHLNLRTLIPAAVVILLLIILAVAIHSCTRGADPSKGSGNPIDSRVAEGVSEDLTKKLATELNRAEQLQQIARTANSYEGTDLVELALREPDAISFVAKYPKLNKAGDPYGESARQGDIPQLFCWDQRWGAYSYDGKPLAITGSAQLVLEMAYIGLTGKTDKTPVDFANSANSEGLSGGEAHTAGSFFEKLTNDLGLLAKNYTSSADNISQILDRGVVLAAQVKPNSLGETDAHWILMVTELEDGSIVVYDPCSTANSHQSWTAQKLANAVDSFYALSLKKSEK